MGITISEDSIRRFIGDEKVYKHGKIIKSLKGIKGCKRDGHVVSAMIEDRKKRYLVTIVFEDFLTFYDWRCSCGASIETGYCRHMAATLLGLEFDSEDGHHYNRGFNYEEIVSFGEEVFTEEADSLHYYPFHGFQPMISPQITQKVPFHIEISCRCHFRMSYKGLEHTWYLKMKAGEERMYVVKKINEFAGYVTEGEPLQFGKNLTYDPARHQLTKESEKLLNFLDMTMKLKQDRYGYYPGYSYHGDGVGNAKELKISVPGAQEKLLEHLESIPFEMEITGLEPVEKKYSINEIVEEDIRLPIRVTYQEGDIHLDEIAGGELDIVPVTSGFKYYLHSGRLYRFTEEHGRRLEHIQSMIHESNGPMTVAKEHFTHFLTSVYPELKKSYEVTLPDDLAEKVIEVSPEPKIYFEQGREGRIMARVVFDYEEETEECYVVRDLALEQKVRGCFAGFDHKENTYLLEDDKAIYRFAEHSLPLLKEMAEIYYEKGMRSLKRPFPKVQTGIGMGKGVWMEVTFDGMDLDGADLEAIYKGLKLKKTFVRLGDGSFLGLEDEGLREHMAFVEAMEITPEAVAAGKATVPLARAIAMESDQETSYDLQRSERYSEVLDTFAKAQTSKSHLPKHYEAIMRPYQITGFRWLEMLAEMGLGGILADDMGLGKTLQTIGLIERYAAISKNPSLVVVPTSLIYNWQEEIQRFAPGLKCLLMIGSKGEREKDRERLCEFDIVITSYNLVSRDIEVLTECDFNYCVLDEAQKIKNPASKMAKAVKRLKAERYLALTGTPMENNLTELWSIYDFIMPGYLHSLKVFKERYSRSDKKTLKALRKKISPFILRRLKGEVLKELPEKIETKSVAQMTKEQQKIYMAYLEQAKENIAADMDSDGYGKSQMKIFAHLTRLRQICCHPGTFVDNYAGGSGKLEQLQEILEDAFEAGHRVLLFSQFTSMLKLIREKLEDQRITYDYLDGSTDPKERQSKVTSFNEGATQVFLISLKAGGTGLNLTGADMVIHFDPWWNPAVEDQATDRAYRIGQKNRVQVIKLIAHGTIEERIYDLQQKKKAMIASVIEPGETMLSKMSQAEVLALFE